MLKLVAALAFLLTLLSSRPARAQERAPTSGDENPSSAVTSLVFDVQKIVETRTGGWKIDRYEYEQIMPDALMSVCRTTDETRSLALAEARREVTRLDGPLDTALEKNGNKIRDLKDLLFATRVAHLLGEAMRRAPSECPTWVTPESDFKARQVAVHRLFLSLDGGGAGMVQYASIHPDGTRGFRGAGGGGGRLLFGWGFDHHWSVRVGPELNVAALVKREGNTIDLPFQYQGAIPVVVRYTDVSWHYNVELAPLVMLTEGDMVPRYGGRIGVLVGISRLRVRRLIPWAGLGATVELFPEVDGRTRLVNLKGGLRAGVDWDF